MRRLLVALVSLTLILLPAAGQAQETAPAEVAWVRHGFAEARTLAAADLVGGPGDEIVLGGRGIALLNGDSIFNGVPARTTKWNADPNNVLDAGDNTWVTGIEVVEVTGDGTEDLLVTTSDTDAYLVDGATGEKVWWNEGTGGGQSFGFALIGGADGPPDLFPTGGKTAISGTTGAPLWEVELPKATRHVASGELDGEPGLDVVMAITPPGAGTNPTSLLGALTAPTVFAVSSEGEPLFEYRAVAPVTSIGTGDLDGDGSDEIVVGTFQGVVVALRADGVPRWTAPTGIGSIDAMEIADLDRDGRDDVVVGNENGNNGFVGEYKVYALSSLGARLWQHEAGLPVAALEAANLDDDPAPEVLVGVGTQFSVAGNQGAAMAIDGGIGTATELWRIDTHKTAMSFAVAEIDGRRVVVSGSADAVLRGVDPATGDVVWTYAQGGYVKRTGAGDLDGDGVSEVASGDDQGQLIVTRADGTRAWSDRLDIGNDGSVSAIAFGDVDGDGEDEVVAAGQRLFTTGDRGTLRLYESDGTLLWSRSFAAAAAAIELRDLDGDGGPEIVIGEGGSTCGVRVVEAGDGTTRWRTGITDCFSPKIDVGDVDGDGALEIVYAEQNFIDEPYIALLEADGSVAWSRGILESSGWVRFVDGGFVHGGWATENRGHVTRRSVADGAIEWQTFLPKVGDRSGASRYGTVLPDVTGDARRDLVASSDASDVHLVDGATGDRLWTTPLEPYDTDPLRNHQAGPVAFVPGTGERPPFVVAAQWSIGRSRSGAFALGLDGSGLAEFALEGEAWSATPVTLANGRPGVVVGAGLGLYAIAGAGA